MNYFTEKFLKLGLTDHVYSNYPLESINELHHLITATPDLKGLNVTVPYKQQVIPLLHDMSPEVREIKAVNCIRISRDPGSIKLSGFNTDVYGFELSLTSFCNNRMPHSALVLGTGGAAQAVAYVLKKLGIGFYFVSNSKSGKGFLSYDQVQPWLLLAHPLIINCTPLGMHPDTGSCPPIPYEHLRDWHYCYDLVYHPEETLFLRQARKNRARTKNGLEMLYLQADKAWEIWHRG